MNGQKILALIDKFYNCLAEMEFNKDMQNALMDSEWGRSYGDEVSYYKKQCLRISEQLDSEQISPHMMENHREDIETILSFI